MKRLIPLLLIAVIANTATIQIVKYSDELPSDKIPFWDNVVSTGWIVCMLVTLVYVIINRKQLFSKKFIAWSILLLIFCTPVPVLAKFKWEEHINEMNAIK